MNRDLEIDLLRSFVAVSSHKNFTKAAHAIGRTQSAVSLQIKRLEDIVGHRLFERTRHSVAITQMGEALLVYAHRILTANDEALSHVKRPEASGLVRIGAPDDYATFLMPPILSQVSKDHPRLQLEVTCDNGADLLKDMDRGHLDIVLATHPMQAVAGEVARYEPLHWVAAPSFVDSPDSPLSLVLFPNGCVCRDMALSSLQDINRPWHIAYSTRSIGLMEQAILSNASVSVMEAAVIPNSLSIIDGKHGLPSLPNVVISVHRSKQSETHVDLVADHMLAKLAGTQTRRVH